MVVVPCAANYEQVSRKLWLPPPNEGTPRQSSNRKPLGWRLVGEHGIELPVGGKQLPKRTVSHHVGRWAKDYFSFLPSLLLLP